MRERDELLNKSEVFTTTGGAVLAKCTANGVVLVS